jgi:hypothetical protein
MQLRKETLLATGMISLAAGLLIGQFTQFTFGGVLVSEFLEGFFVGLAIVMNLAYMVRIKTVKKSVC